MEVVVFSMKELIIFVCNITSINVQKSDINLLGIVLGRALVQRGRWVDARFLDRLNRPALTFSGSLKVTYAEVTSPECFLEGHSLDASTSEGKLNLLGS